MKEAGGQLSDGGEFVLKAIKVLSDLLGKNEEEMGEYLTAQNKVKEKIVEQAKHYARKLGRLD